MSILCAFQQHLQQCGCLAQSFSFWAGSEIQNNPEQITGAGSLPVTLCTSSAYLFFVLTVKQSTGKMILKGLGASEVCHPGFAPPTPPV